MNTYPLRAESIAKTVVENKGTAAEADSRIRLRMAIEQWRLIDPIGFRDYMDRLRVRDEANR